MPGIFYSTVSNIQKIITLNEPPDGVQIKRDVGKKDVEKGRKYGII